MQHPIYTVGYSGLNAADFIRTIKELDALLVDIRFSPRSRNPVWTRKRLTEVLGNQYHHLRELGNKNYRGGPIKIVDLDAGAKFIEEKRQHQPIILMCVCKKPELCHRTHVVATLQLNSTELKIQPRYSQLRLL